MLVRDSRILQVTLLGTLQKHLMRWAYVCESIVTRSRARATVILHWLGRKRNTLISFSSS